MSQNNFQAFKLFRLDTRICLGALIFCACTLFCLSAVALEEWENVPVDAEVSLETMIESLPKFVKTPEGGVAWEVLAKTEGKEVITGQFEDNDVISVRPVFPDEVKALDGQTVLMQGYMFPLEQAEKQGRFLFGPFPASCPYHYHVGPNMVVEVQAKYPIVFSFDPMTLSGRLELVPADDEFNVFYRMKDAVVHKP